jgi:hypothetical protein
MTGYPSHRPILADHPTSKVGRYNWLAAVVGSCFNWLNLNYRNVNVSIEFHVYLSIYGSTAHFLDLGRVFSFLILYTVGRTPWTSDQPVARPLPRQKTTQTQNKRTQTSMPPVGFELTITVFERAKTVHALDRAATLVGPIYRYLNKIIKV